MKKLALPLGLILILMMACNLPIFSVPSPTSQPVLPTDMQAATSEIPSTMIPVEDSPTPIFDVALPIRGFAVFLDNGQVSFHNADGSMISTLNTPSFIYGYRQNIHIAGDMPEGAGSTPLIYTGEQTSSLLIQNVQGVETPFMKFDNFFALVGAPARPIIAYTLIKNFDGQVFVGTPDTLPGAAPVLDLNDPSGYAIKPLSLIANDMTPTTMWYSFIPYGIGGDIVFEPRRELWRMDLATGVTTQILNSEQQPVGLSTDVNLIAYTALGGDPGPLNIFNLISGSTLPIPLLPSSDRGAGDAVFSPDNNLVAWKEGSGFQMADVPNFHATLRIARLADGSVIREITDDSFNAYVSFAPVGWLQPVGWLDDQSLLLEVRGMDWGTASTAVIKVDVNTGDIVNLAGGEFLGLLYP
jgi:hypothetical protein